jgi:hypothetical protein
MRYGQFSLRRVENASQMRPTRSPRRVVIQKHGDTLIKINCTPSQSPRTADHLGAQLALHRAPSKLRPATTETSLRNIKLCLFLSIDEMNRTGTHPILSLMPESYYIRSKNRTQAIENRTREVGTPTINLP